MISTMQSWLTQRHPATFGRVFEAFVVVWAALLCGYLPATLETERIVGTDPNVFATILSPFRGPILAHPLVETGFVIGMWLFGALWLCQRWVPISPWLCAVFFTLAWAVRLENMGKTIHVSHLSALMLWILAWWRQTTLSEYLNARNQRTPWSGLYYPEWVFQTCLAATCIFYGWAGWSKLIESGLDWPNGISMQLWTRLWGNPHFFATQWILDSRPLATFLQAMSLTLEVFAPLALLSKCRIWIGMGLVGMHLGIVSVFGWGFHGNMIIIALLMLPFRNWFEEGQLNLFPFLNITTTKPGAVS